MGRRDVGGDERKHGSDQRRIVGKAEPCDDVGDEIERQDEIGDCRKQHGPDAYRGGGVERAIIARDDVLGEGHLPGKALELGPEVSAHLALGQRSQGDLLAKGRIAQLARVVPGHHDRNLASC
jgi:hypothetical protein